MIVNQSHAQKASWRARGSTQKSVVRVVTIIGWSLDFQADTRASKYWSFDGFELCLSSLDIFFEILSIRMIASFTTTHIRAINHIAKGIEYGFQVKYSQIFTQRKASTTEYKIITGRE